MEIKSKTGKWLKLNKKDFIEDLNPLNIEARYPDYKSKIAQMMTKDVTKSILFNTKQLLQWIKQKI